MKSVRHHGEAILEDTESCNAPSKTLCRLAFGLLAVHMLLLVLSIPQNAVTIDEVVHLPVGISYWHRGEFWPYHHNPPLIRLMFSLPAVLADSPIDYRAFRYVPRSRRADCELGRDFMLLNSQHYMGIYAMCRAVVAGLSVLGGYVIFRWSWQLFGNAGSLISLSLWVFDPNVLAHGGLVTPDVGSTVIGFLATYRFWRYLTRPDLLGAIECGILLGLTEATKFSFALLPLLWVALVAVKLWRDWRIPTAQNLTWHRAIGHALVVMLISLLVLNDVYLGEGTGQRLGMFDFRSKALTVETLNPETAAPNQPAIRENRFRGTILENVPVPLPEHYLLGFDDQMYDVDSGGYYKYLRGELRRGDGWWYYYLYCLLVKTPLGSLALAAIAVLAAVASRRCRTGLLAEVALLLPIIVFLAFISSGTGLNSHLRYVLPIYPFAFVFAGRLGRLVTTQRPLWMATIVAALIVNVTSVLHVHPHYLTYFNEAAGGPGNGLSHLADSNIDWGQGLIALRDWLDERAPGQKIRLAYFGTMFPEVLGIKYELPPVDEPIPGLQAVSANYLLGIPFPAPNGQGRQSGIPLNAFTYYGHFKPIAIPGNSIFVYDLSVEDVQRVRHELNLLPWRSEDEGPLIQVDQSAE